MRFGGLAIDTVVCLTLAKWETVSGQFGGYLNYQAYVDTLSPEPSVEVHVQKECDVVREHQLRMPAKGTVKSEKAEDKLPKQSQSETGRYLLQIDRQSKRSFKTPEAARSAAMEINPAFQLYRFSE
jgi:hypothetical protein